LRHIPLLVALVCCVGLGLQAAEDSVDLLPVLKGESDRAHDTLVHQCAGSYAMPSGDWVLVGAKSKGAPEGRLYNLKDDLGQNRDLASGHPEKVAELTELYRSIRAEK